MQDDGWSVEDLATRYAVSIDAISTQLVNVCFLEPVLDRNKAAAHTSEPLALNEEQQAAVGAPLPTLVVAGPGTGKTRSIVGKYLQLIEAGVDPAKILALTFSNKAAEEMRARIALELQRVHRPHRRGGEPKTLINSPSNSISSPQAWG